MHKHWLMLIGAIASTLFISCSNEVLSPQLDNDSEINPQKSLSVAQARQDMFTMLSILEGTKSRDARRIISSEYMMRVMPRGRSRSSESIHNYYIFNFENDGGFAIMSADTQYSELVALADSGHLVPNEPIENPGLVMLLSKSGGSDDEPKSGWIGWYQSRYWEPIERHPIEHHEVFQWNPDVVGDGTSPKDSDENYTIKYTNQEVICEVQPICLADWGQGYPYNEYFPSISSGEKPKTGSLATAIGEIMFAYQYPETLSGDTIPWARMQGRYLYANGKFDTQAKKIRSKLLRRLGDPENLDMHYGKDYSYASPANVMRTLASFGYSGTGVLKIMIVTRFCLKSKMASSLS